MMGRLYQGFPKLESPKCGCSPTQQQNISMHRHLRMNCNSDPKFATLNQDHSDASIASPILRLKY